MGEFRIQVDRCFPFRLPNMQHKEGISAVLDAMIAGDSLAYRIGITSCGLQNLPSARPNHLLDRPAPELIPLNADSTYAQLRNRYCLDGGAATGWGESPNWGGQFKALGWNPKSAPVRTVTASVAVDGHAVKIATTLAEFANGMGWATTPDPDGLRDVEDGMDEVGDPEDEDAPVGVLGSADHGYPYTAPKFWPGTLVPDFTGTSDMTHNDVWGTFATPGLPAWVCPGCYVYVDGAEYAIREVRTREIDVWGLNETGEHHWAIRCSPTVREIEGRPWRGVSMPIGAIYLIAGEALVASAQCGGALRIAPGSTLKVSYSALLRNAV